MLYSESLRKNDDFRVVFNSGTSYANRYLVMYIKKNDTAEKENQKNRIGISVSKKVGNSIVRHRVKRLIKESYRLNEQSFKRGLDIVVIARNTSKGHSYKDIESALLHLGRLHHILSDRKDTAAVSTETK